MLLKPGGKDSLSASIRVPTWRSAADSPTSSWKRSARCCRSPRPLPEPSKLRDVYDVGKMDKFSATISEIAWSSVSLPLDLVVSKFRLPTLVRLSQGKDISHKFTFLKGYFPRAAKQRRRVFSNSATRIYPSFSEQSASV